MKKGAIFLLLISCTLSHALPSTIDIRLAAEHDLPALFELDRIVSYEYFLPIYSSGYPEPLASNPAYFLALELEEDKKWFPECIAGNAESLWVAYDQTANALAGLIVAHQSSAEVMEIDLLLILKKYRGNGIGKALIHHAINAFPDSTLCEVYPLKFNNKVTLAFYEAVGFVNHGAPTFDKINLYGVPYKDMYYHLTYAIPSRETKRSMPRGNCFNTRTRSIR